MEHGPGIDSARDLVCVPNLPDDTVSVIDGVTQAVVVTLPPAGAPYALDQPVTVAVSLAASKIYMANASGDSVVILDRLTYAHVATVATVAAGDAQAERAQRSSPARPSRARPELSCR